jgi:hypothetical protein
MPPGVSNIFGGPQYRKDLQVPESARSNLLDRAVVIDICDGLNQGQIAALLLASNPNIVASRIPINACVVRPVTAGAQASNPTAILAYPFFSSHISMPVKVGETVWIVYDSDPNTTAKNFAFWLSRVHGDIASEDVNFSHHDRRILPSQPSIEEPGTAEKAGAIANEVEAEDFPDLSLTQPDDEVNGYEEIFVLNDGKPVKFEPVPRLYRRPGDLILQGSNNATISLTTDRGWYVDEDPIEKPSNATSGSNDFSGTIDLVAGRSRWISTSEKVRTVPETRENSRGFFETVKDVGITKLQNSPEGDPDFLSDAARLYISMATKSDTGFGLKTMTPKFPGDEDSDDEEVAAAAIISKSDTVRIIARKDEEHAINGSILIVKEGDTGEANDLGAISIRSDGSIVISGSRIFIGRSKADGGLGDGPDDAPDGAQPYVKYKQLEDLLKAIMKDINDFCDTLSKHTTPGYGAPSVQITQAAATLKAAMVSRESEIVNLKSERIFGE